MSNKSLDRGMNAAALDHRSEVRRLLERIAGPTGSVKERINRAARRLRWNYSRTEDLWQPSRRAVVRAEELEQARLTAREIVGASIDTIEDLKARIAALESQIGALLQR